MLRSNKLITQLMQAVAEGARNENHSSLKCYRTRYDKGAQLMSCEVWRESGGDPGASLAPVSRQATGSLRQGATVSLQC